MIEDCTTRKNGKPKHKNAAPQKNRPKVQEIDADTKDVTQQMNPVIVSSIWIPSLQQPHLNY